MTSGLRLAMTCSRDQGKAGILLETSPPNDKIHIYHKDYNFRHSRFLREEGGSAINAFLTSAWMTCTSLTLYGAN